MIHRLAPAFAAVFFAAMFLPASAAKIPLNYKAYDTWNSIQGTVLSQHGTWLAYALVAQDADGTLVVRDLRTGKELREPRGKAPAFSEDERFVFYTIAPTYEQLDNARRKHLRGDQAPKSGLGILNLATGEATAIPRVKSYAVAKHGAHWVAYLREAPEKPGSSPAPNPSPRSPATPNGVQPTPPALATPQALASPPSSTPPSPLPSASAAPVPENKKKADTSTLVLRNLDTGVEQTIDNVSEYAISDDERFLAFVTQTARGTNDGVQIRDLRAGSTTNALAGAGRYVSLTFAPDRETLAFLTDRDSYATAAPHFDAYLWEAGTARAVVQETTGGLPRYWSPSADGTLKFSKDGHRLFLGARVAPSPLPSNTPEPMAVDLWNWHDARLQTEQKVEADDDRKATFTGLFDLSGNRYVQLGTPNVANITWNDNPNYALGINYLPYQKMLSWDNLDSDNYLISLKNGTRRLIARNAREECTLSPAGTHALCYDERQRAWFAVRARDGKKTNLTRGLHVAFYDEQDDHPAPPPPYGAIGWTKNDGRVLIADRYDIWSFAPDGGSRYRLTNGYGRAHKLRFDYINLTPSDPAIDPGTPLYLLALNDVTKAGGVYRVNNALGSSTPHVLIAGPKIYSGFVKAKDADRIVFRQSSFDQYPNLWSSTLSFASPVKVSDANPQMAQYLWGREHLFHYRTTAGKPLDGIYYTPENFNPHTRYPMLVYIYERFADTLHQFYSPGPGTGPNFPRYVSNGYIVMIPDIIYTNGHPGRSALNAVMPAVDAMLARGFIDPQRVGISGHSWGAYEIAYMLTRTHRFAAAEAGAAVADMPSAFGGIRWGSGLVRDFQYEHGQSRIGATPWDRPDLYLENSALFHAPNVRTPYLTIANDNDDAVPWYQGIEFFTALRRLNREAYMFSFNGEFHNLRGREQQKYWTVHLDEFFDHFLQGKPAPQWMLHGVDYLHRGTRDVRPLFGEKP